MDLFLNELSLEGQFPSPADFRPALDTMMRMRELARRHGRAIRVPTALSGRAITGQLCLRDYAMRHADINVRRALLAWVDKDGPFIETDQLSQPGDDAVCLGRAVTGSSIVEAACRATLDTEVALAGFTPSAFDVHPLPVELAEAGQARRVEVENYWQQDRLHERLLVLAPAVGSWRDFDEAIRRDIPEIVFAPDAVRLSGYGFNPGVAERLRRLLVMLATMKRSILPDGTYGQEWHERWEQWFRGGELFSDSSDGEKVDYDTELTFKHPEQPGTKLKCTWHGKVNTPKLRIHFSWPITRDSPLYVVYIGPKITRK